MLIERSYYANAPNYGHIFFLNIGIEVLASALLMIVICIIVYTKG
jgi:hypothetical protein